MKNLIKGPPVVFHGSTESTTIVLDVSKEIEARIK